MTAKKKSDQTVQEWRILNEEELRCGYRRVLRRRFLMPDGREADYDIKQETDCIAILAFTEGQQVILTRQYRPGPKRILLEIPGGGMEPDETPLQAAQRELLEETGCEGDIQFVTSNVDCAYSTLTRYNFVATNCRFVADLKLDENEYIEVVLLPLSEFRQLLRSGQLSDVEAGYLGLDYLGWL